jgi:phosphotransferase system HPr (HPr) family protein
MSDCRRCEVRLPDSEGLHLRAASQIAQLAQQFRAQIRVFGAGGAADGKSVLDLLTLGAECGAPLEVEADGPDAQSAIAALLALIENRLGDASVRMPPTE